jgi:hypothetical protein
MDFEVFEDSSKTDNIDRSGVESTIALRVDFKTSLGPDYGIRS